MTHRRSHGNHCMNNAKYGEGCAQGYIQINCDPMCENSKKDKCKEVPSGFADFTEVDIDWHSYLVVEAMGWCKIYILKTLQFYINNKYSQIV